MIVRLRIACSALLLLATAFSVSAHEFWINPARFQFEPGAEILAEFRNGEEFSGVQLGYFGRSSKTLVIVGPNGVTPITPRDGDRPAIEIKAPSTPGLYTLGHETTLSRLTYREWAKWQKFVKHKDLAKEAASHEARGLPRENFREGYTRHAKSLIAVGDGAGNDTNLGMETEFVALTNPYAPGFDGTMKAQLFYQGKPRANAQVEVFEEGLDQGVTISIAHTDASGVVTLKTTPGRKYQIDAVVLRVPLSDEANVAWETLWANMTFAHP